MIKRTFGAHPLMILRLMKPYLFVLILPLIRAVVQFLRQGRANGILSLEITAFVAITAVAIFRFRCILLSISNNRLTVNKGFIFRSRSVIEISRISSVSIRRGPIDAIFGSADCSINTEAGRPTKPDFRIKMRLEEAERLFSLVYGQEKTTVIKFSALRVALLAAATSSAATGLVIGVPIANGAAKLLGVALSDMVISGAQRISEQFNMFFPLTVNIITLLLVAAYGISVIITFFKHVKFKLITGQSRIEVQSGLFVRKRTVFKKHSVNNICLQQTSLMRAFQMFSMRVSIGGYGDSRGEKAVIVPAGRHNELKERLKTHFPFFRAKQEGIKPLRTKTNISRFLLLPTVFAMAIISLMLMAMIIFPFFDRLILFVGIVLLCVDLYYGSICLRDSKRSELVLGEQIFAAGSIGVTVRELYCSRNRVGSIKITETPADRRLHTCKTKIVVRSESADSVRVKNISLTTVLEKIREIYNVEV